MPNGGTGLLTFTQATTYRRLLIMGMVNFSHLTFPPLRLNAFVFGNANCSDSNTPDVTE